MRELRTGMNTAVNVEPLIECGLAPGLAEQRAVELARLLETQPPIDCWHQLTTTWLNPQQPFALHLHLYRLVYSQWDPAAGPPPAWLPRPDGIKHTNLGRLMGKLGLNSYTELHAWSVRKWEEYWAYIIAQLKIRFHTPYAKIADVRRGLEAVEWLPGAELNIAESCFGADPAAVAIIHQAEGGELKRISYGELERLSNRVAGGIVRAGFAGGERIAICMPMGPEAVAIYLGIVKAGCAVISVAESFSPQEVQARLEIAGASGVFTQVHMLRGGKLLPLYAKMIEAQAPRAIVLDATEEASAGLRPGDLKWSELLSDNEAFPPVSCEPMAAINILFSSGTTGEPKAIPFNHTTPIKCAADALMHQNVQPGDVVVWPTSLGWMMGPWLIFASLMNRATMGLFEGSPGGREFGQFVAASGATMLGVVPSLVRTWRESRCMEGLDWSRIKAFSSTGECSNVEDMLYLMHLADYKPVIEYCGGTELGGGYITGTVLQPAAPSTFTTPALGLDFKIIDALGRPVSKGEAFLVPPSIGLSQILLNQDHHQIYYANTPPGDHGPLRRHGDQIERLPGGYFRAHGRMDDTFNLGGIKVSSAELECILNTVELVQETACIGVSPAGGPDRLVVFAVMKAGITVEAEQLKQALQKTISTRINPLFKVHDIRVVDKLPLTSSNKVMRRVLRDRYLVVNASAGQEGN